MHREVILCMRQQTGVRMRVVASHLSEGMDTDELEGHQRRIREAMLAQAGPNGFEYHFSKLFAIAAKPA